MATTSNRFIDPAVLARIGSLQLIAKTVVEGFLAGLHRSPYHGFSLDFAEYREYSPGDDIRHVDWKVYGRMDRFYVKKYEGDTNTQLYLLLDVSRSMDFSSHQLSKLDYARYLAASLAYFAIRQNDAVGLICFDSDVTAHVAPRTRLGHLFALLSALEQMKVGARTDIGGAMGKMAHLIRKRTLIVLISDLYQEPEKIAKALRFFHYRGNDVVLFHVLDPVELEMPFSEISTLEDMETEEFLAFAPEQSRRAYLDLLQDHISTLRKECRNVYIDYQLLSTREPLDQAVHRYLSMREKSY